MNRKKGEWVTHRYIFLVKEADVDKVWLSLRIRVIRVVMQASVK